MVYVRWVVGQVQEQGDTLHTAILFKISREKATRLQVDTHGTENDGKVLLVSVVNIFCRFTNQTSLAANLSGDLVMWQTGSGENGDLLATGNGVHCIDSGNTGRDHFFGIHLCPLSPYNNRR